MADNQANKPANLLETSGSIRPTGRLVLRKMSKDGTEAIRIADSEGRSSETDLDEQGSLRQSIKGASPQGETGSIEVCKILFERLNQDGSHWGVPSKPKGQEGGTDCIATDGSQSLNVQVTRAVDSGVWAALASSSGVIQNTTVESAADSLRSAVKRKESIPPSQRASILLALDVVDTPGLAVSAVVDSFRQRYGVEVRALGFAGIWVVGPTAALTMRLDSNWP